ncbi:unnamed protein product [Chilo suppressalis]|uniref:Fas-binding factor 1 C-terminal domain-containing protein n=1 Tax=Chilo suppressalis TaxID=168631 RepID=A0ABN8ASQ2_CHISP|nr:unnamed protein product [Chilo suppressalis]
MSFNVDDPLAGILSDGSDDSFFDDDIIGKKKPTKAKATPTPEKKNTLFDLESNKPKNDNFNIGKSDSVRVNDSTKNYKPVSPAPFKRELSKESVQLADNKFKPATDTAKSPAKPKISASIDPLDILGDLNQPKKETIKPLEKGKSSQSLLDDILGGPSVKPSSTQVNRPIAAAKSQEFDFASILGKESKSSDSKPTSQKTTAKPEKPSKEERVPKKTKSSNDWLGIFNDGDENDNVADMPSWLGGETKKKRTETEATAIQQQAATPAAATAETVPALEERRENELTSDHISHNFNKISSAPVLHSSKEDLTAEGASLYLQQQESQLMVALQLKAQEEKLAAMQMRQKESQRIQREAALAHHEQLDAMLQQQTQHRHQMQSIINAHQERIAQRIKALLGTVNQDDGSEIHNNIDNTPVDRENTPRMKEKKQLLQLVQSLQENHDKEIDLMEISYRRQLAFLEVSLNQYEERMKEESEKLTRYYSEKIAWLDEHHLQYKRSTEDNLTSLTERHKAETEMLRLQHLENVKVLQEHHAALMENIKNAVKHEQALIQDSVGFSADLRELVSNVNENKLQSQQLLEKVQSLVDNTQSDMRRALQTRESQLTDMVQQLKIDRENFEKEKTETREMVNLLEKRLKQMTTMIEEESAMLKQKKMEFEFEKATFGKQTEFAKNVLKKQDEEIKTLRENIEKEYQDKIAKINEEKCKAERDSALISKEKASINSLKQELDKIKADLRAQLDEVSEERLKINLEKQQIHMEEQRVMAKSRDLDMLAKAAIEKQSHADKKYSEAELVQAKYEERIRRIQEHVISLNTREKQIAKEKVALSRERLNLHNERKKVENRQQCSLCRSAQFAPQYNFESVYPDSFMNVSVSRDQGDVNVNTAMSAIASEIVNLKMNKNFDLKSRYAGNSAGDAGVPADENLQTTIQTQSASGGFKDYNMDPKFMMLRLDVQQVLNNLDQNIKSDEDPNENN